MADTTSLEYYLSPEYAAKYAAEQKALEESRGRVALTKRRNWEALHGEPAPRWM